MTAPVRRSVVATAPVRVADVGGWTDTWFAPRGAVCPLGVGPGITVAADLLAGPVTDRPVRIIAVDLDEDYHCGPDPDRGWAEPLPGRHPLLEHAIASVFGPTGPPGPVRLRLHAAVPPGASLGTSAAVVVALLAASEALVGDRPAALTDDRRRALAVRAHQVETERAGRESGVQDQWAAAFGGAQLVQMTGYPDATRHPIGLSQATRDRLAATTVTVGVGRHDSSRVHHEVIAAITGPDRTGSAPRAVLDELAALAHDAAAALTDEDLDTWADTLTRCTDAQQRLHPALVGPAHRAVIDQARRGGATGWKVNGAGGSGGSVTVAFATASDADRFAHHVGTVDPTWAVFDLTPSGGVDVTQVG